MQARPTRRNPKAPKREPRGIEGVLSSLAVVMADASRLLKRLARVEARQGKEATAPRIKKAAA